MGGLATHKQLGGQRAGVGFRNTRAICRYDTACLSGGSFAGGEFAKPCIYDERPETEPLLLVAAALAFSRDFLACNRANITVAKEHRDLAFSLRTR